MQPGNSNKCLRRDTRRGYCCLSVAWVFGDTFKSDKFLTVPTLFCFFKFINSLQRGHGGRPEIFIAKRLFYSEQLCIGDKNMMHELLNINEHVPVIARFYDYERFTYPWHFHREYEIIYFAEGEGHRFVADNMEAILPGDIILMGSGVPHYMRSSEKYYANDASLRINGTIVQFAHNFMSYAISNYTDMKPIRELLKIADRGVHFPAPGNAELIGKIMELPMLKGIERIVRLLLLLDKMAHFPRQRILGTPHFNLPNFPYTGHRMEKVLVYMNRRYTENIDLNDIARIASMNTSAFCRYFKGKTGKSPVNYIQELRIGYACKLLTSSHLDILQICIECGFNTPSFFNKIFKRSTGLTPAEYRKQFLK